MKSFVISFIIFIIFALFVSTALALKEKDHQHLAHDTKLRKGNPIVDIIQSILNGGGDEEEEDEDEEDDEEAGDEEDEEDEEDDDGEEDGDDLSLRRVTRNKINNIKSNQRFKSLMKKAVQKIAYDGSSGEEYNNCIANHTLVFTTPCDYTQQAIYAINDCLPYAGDLAPLITQGICDVQNAYLAYCQIKFPFCEVPDIDGNIDGDDQNEDNDGGDDEDDGDEEEDNNSDEEENDNNGDEENNNSDEEEEDE